MIFYVDESSFKLLPNVVRSYFRKGTKAILEHKFVRKALNVISGVSPCGKLVYHLRNSAFKGVHMADFLRKIMKTFPYRKIIVIWDGATAHSAQQVKDFLRTLQPGRLELYKQPAHSPELNPDEQVWKYLKVESNLRNHACKSFKELREKLIQEIEDLKNDPERIEKMFHHPECAFY